MTTYWAVYGLNVGFLEKNLLHLRPTQPEPTTVSPDIRFTKYSTKITPRTLSHIVFNSVSESHFLSSASFLIQSSGVVILSLLRFP